MYFDIISSGSKGNATLVVGKNTVLLIDMGITLTRLEEGLKECNLCKSDITAAIFTHNHADHINGLKFLSPSIMYGLEGTLPGSLSHTCELFKPFSIGEFKITPIKTSHDATNPCGYVIEDDNEKLVYVTDTGYFVPESIEYAKDPTYIVLESNHDIKMLLKTNRPYELKCRIMSEHGHLCNEDSAMAAVELLGPHTKEIVLAHLSEEANTPELALDAYHKVFRYHNININKYALVCANQHHSVFGGHRE